MKISKFQWAIIFGILVVGLVAFIDLQGINLIGDGYTQGVFDISVWYHHLTTALIIFSIIPLCYWFFYRKDKSEIAAIYLVGLIMFYFGLADILYFWFQGLSVPQFLAWLDTHIIISKFGSPVTNISLYMSVFAGFIISLFAAKILKEKF